jgi:Protein of unknown function (DUF1569)
MLKSLFQEADYKVIVSRIEALTPENTRQWGKMDAAQMMAHASLPLEQGSGKIPFKDESNFFTRTVVKWIVLRMIKKNSMGKNSPTVPSFVVTDERVFNNEKQRLLDNLKAFYDKGQKGELPPHPGFGKFTTEQWGTLQHLHLHHHLTQFSA